MREKLPPYIVECLIVSGFDAIDSIVEMNTEDGPKNSIDLIETYIEKRKESFPQCMGPNQIPNTPFEFPPGHRIIIEKFVNNVKHHYRIKKVTVQDMKPRKTNQRPKKRKIESSDATDEDDYISSVTEEICKKVFKWSSENCDEVSQENVHFTVNVCRNTLDSSEIVASIRCKCGSSQTINRKPTGSKPWQLSNWTKHYKQCKRVKNKGPTLKQTFFSPKVKSKSSIPSSVPVTSASYQSTGCASGIITPFVSPYVHTEQSNPTSASMLVPSSQFNNSLSLQQFSHTNMPSKIYSTINDANPLSMETPLFPSTPCTSKFMWQSSNYWYPNCDASPSPLSLSVTTDSDIDMAGSFDQHTCTVSTGNQSPTKTTPSSSLEAHPGVCDTSSRPTQGFR